MTRYLFSAVLKLYPSTYKDAFREEMLAALDGAQSDYQGQGPRAKLSFACREVAGVIRGLASEWLSRPGYTLVGSPAHAAAMSDAPEVVAAQQRVRFALRRMEHAIAHHDFPNARRWAAEEEQLRANLQNLLAENRNSN